MITLEQELLIRQQAIETFPEEGVWLVTEKGCRQVENIHEHPTKFFQVSPEDSLKASREGLLAVIHSHCEGTAAPSAEDMALFEQLQIPCGILSTDGESTSDFVWMTNDIPELEGRGFIHGVSDCFSLARDYYRLQGIELDYIPRDWNWWATGDNLIEDLFEANGFYEISKDEAREGDGWLCQIRGDVIHHCGIYLGNELILHHPGANQPIDSSKLSVKEPIFRFLPYITKFVRYRGKP